MSTFFGLTFEPKMDVGHFLTFLTLVAGFLWWLYSTIHDWRRRAEDDARSGALRLLLHFLREEKGKPVRLDDLFARFNEPEAVALRRAYCGKDFTFKNRPAFESAVYRLDFEGKIRFFEGDSVAFRLDRDWLDQAQPNPGIALTPADVARVVAALDAAIADTDVPTWEVERLARSAMAADADQTLAVIRKHLHGSAKTIARRAAEIAGQFGAKAAVA